MNSNPSQGQNQQQQPVQGGNTSPGQQRADHAPDMKPPASEPGDDGAGPGRDDSNRTPWQGQQPLGQPSRPQQGDAVGRQQQQQGSPSEDTDDAGDTQPSGDARQSTGNN